MKFDRTINLGHILILVGIIASAFSGYMTIRLTVDNHELRIESIERSISAQETINKNLTKLLWDIKRDVAVIKDRSDRDESRSSQAIPEYP